MADQICIRPGEGKKVRLENGLVLPQEGMEVVHTTFVERRIQSGDAVVVEAPSISEFGDE